MSELKNVLSHFKKVDPVLFSRAKAVSIDALKPRQPKHYFQCLCREIIGQQLSGKVARTIFERVVSLFPDRAVNANSILKISKQKLRDAGMAWSKVNAIKDLAEKTVNGDLDFRKIRKMNNDEVVDVLMQVKGIGPWTSEMFLMFTLGREDVFSVKDLGLKKAMINIYGLSNNVKDDEIERISNKWGPYRTYACLVLWKSLEE